MQHLNYSNAAFFIKMNTPIQALSILHYQLSIINNWQWNITVISKNAVSGVPILVAIDNLCKQAGYTWSASLNSKGKPFLTIEFDTPAKPNKQ